MAGEWSNKIFSVTEPGFEKLALEIFRFQYDQNDIYRSYVNVLSVDPGDVKSLDKIPFLPINFFKTHRIKTGKFEAEKVFESSGTTGSVTSHHPVKDQALYSLDFTLTFEKFYGPVAEWCILGLMPERENSSLVNMVTGLIEKSAHPSSGFYFQNPEDLIATISKLEAGEQKTILIGLTFALLDFAEKYSGYLPDVVKQTIIMETGGMKGRRQEITRQELHAILKKTLGVNQVHSEYGMTELLSQAYSKSDGLFVGPPWLKILVRDEEDPLRVRHLEGVGHIEGAINIIDLANVFSCSFIATSDAGRLYANGSFEILGRLDGSDLRGCSLMVATDFQ